ncbi:MAG: hypothetical protein ACT4OG_07345 [Alphaproteobacteria bacterium]
MNKIDEAWAILKTLPADKQEIAAEAILDFAERSEDVQLSEQQITALQRRLQDQDAKSITLEEFRSRVRKLGS